jgi:hypothetical protein
VGHVKTEFGARERQDSCVADDMGQAQRSMWGERVSIVSDIVYPWLPSIHPPTSAAVATIFVFVFVFVKEAADARASNTPN